MTTGAPIDPNGKFAVFCKADRLATTTQCDGAISMELAKQIFFNHAHNCKDRDNLWIWYLAPGEAWRPIKKNKQTGEFEA